jgi:WD40 repeat protein
VLVQDVSTGKVTPYKGHVGGGPLGVAAWARDGTLVATGSADGTVIVWDSATGATKARLVGPAQPVAALWWGPANGRLVALHLSAPAGEKTQLVGWDVATGARAFTLAGTQTWNLNEAENTVAMSGDGKWVAACGWGAQRNEIVVWDAESGRASLTIPLFTRSISLNRDGSRLAALTSNGIRVWEAPSGKEVCAGRLKRPTLSAGKVSLSPDGKRLVTILGQGNIDTWDAVTGARLASLEVVNTFEGVVTTAWSPDGKRLAVCSSPWTKGNNGAVKIFDAGTGGLLLTIPVDEGARIVSAVRWSPDGKRLAAGSAAGTVLVWDSTTGKGGKLPGGHLSPISDLRWSADGARLVSAGYDRTATVWDGARGKALLTYRGNLGDLPAAILSGGSYGPEWLRSYPISPPLQVSARWPGAPTASAWPRWAREGSARSSRCGAPARGRCCTSSTTARAAPRPSCGATTAGGSSPAASMGPSRSGTWRPAAPNCSP